MKVLYITNYDTMYGANTSLLGMMAELKQNFGVEPYLLVPGGGEIKKLCDREGIPCFCYDFRISALDENTRYLKLRKWTRRGMRYVDFYRVWKAISKEKIGFDLVHSNSSIFDIGYFLARRWRVPHIWHVREFVKEDYGLESVVGKNVLKRQLSGSDAVIAISDKIKKEILKQSRMINVRKIYNGVRVTRQYTKSYRKGNITRFCIIGTIQTRKNQLDAVVACKKLEEKNFCNFQLYIVGGRGGTYYEEILEYLNQNPTLSDKIIFTGYCDDVNLFLLDKDVGIMASDAEAFGRVTVEYMANYMPVIATKTGGTPEVVGEAGDYFLPHDIDSLAELMALYIEDEERVCIKGNLARERAVNFTTERNAERIYEVYKEVSHAAG